MCSADRQDQERGFLAMVAMVDSVAAAMECRYILAAAVVAVGM